LSTDAYEKHLLEILPGPEDEARLATIFKERDWILPVERGSAS
jgi:hypothetical protein